MTERRKAENGQRRPPGKAPGRRPGIAKRGDQRAPKPNDKGARIALVPTLRDRLFQEMDGARIPSEGRLQFLCSMTGRRPQTVRRWIALGKPGLPDLGSFASICAVFDTDANWMLGLTKTRYTLPRAASGPTDPSPGGAKLHWIDAVRDQIADEADGCETFYMPGDDMEPGIKDGTPLLVDTKAKEIAGNGTYVLEYRGRTLVRNVEHRIGEGLVLSCENPKYKATLLKDPNFTKRMGLKVLGRVRVAILARRM